MLNSLYFPTEQSVFPNKHVQNFHTDLVRKKTASENIVCFSSHPLQLFANIIDKCKYLSTKTYVVGTQKSRLKAAYAVTMNIFRNFYFLFESFVKVEISYVFTIKMFSTAKNCMEK